MRHELRTHTAPLVRVLILAAFLAPGLAQAQLYKWVDENGHTQYSDRPPPAGVKSERLSTGRGPSPTAEPAPAAVGSTGTPAKPAPTAASRDLEFKKRQLSAEEQQKDDEKKAKEQKAKQENCDIARSRLRQLEEGGRILKFDKAGERTFMSDEDIDKEKAPAKAKVEEACKA